MRISTFILLLFSSAPVIGQTYNSVKNWTAKKPISNEVDIISPSRTVQEVSESTQFMDGFARPVQSVVKQISPLQQDLVNIRVYDVWGREVQQYLPFVYGNDGAFKANAQTLGLNFNQALYPGETNFYGQADLENSPVGRTLKTYAPGGSWVGSSRGSTVRNVANTPDDKVQIWNIDAAPGSLPANAGAYPAGQLYKTIATNEKGLQVVTFKNKEDQVVMGKTQLTAGNDDGSGRDHVGWQCTYYVYDDYDNLRFIITPKVVSLIDGTWVISQTLADELCYRFEYDDFKREVIHKNPGTPAGVDGEVWTIYDKRGRQAMIQDGNLRNLHKWQYYQYDAQDRVISIGLIADPGFYNNRTYHQTNALGQTNYPNLGSYSFEVLSQTFYDNYNWVAGTGSGLGASLDASNISNGNLFYVPSNNSAPYPQPIAQTAMTRGLVTGSKTEILESNGSQYLYTISFYDDKGRIIQTQGNNITGGIDKVTSQYNWLGLALRVYEQHNKNGNGSQSHNILTKMNYDHAGRLLAITKNISSTVNGSPVNSGDKLINTYTYNELGQVKTKTLGNTLETLDFDYNVRGWVTGINKNYTMAGNTGHWFGMELGYDKTTTTAGTTSFSAPSYDGSITGEIWRTRGDGVSRKYDYSYDNANQITAAAFLQNSSSSIWDKSYMDFSLNNVSYDLNGNIKTLNQNGFVLGGPPGLDNLTYNYLNGDNSNRLQNVIDIVNNANSKLGDFHYSGSKTSGSVDYTFDYNGNLVSDVNKGITAISYNAMNLPFIFTFSNGTTITYFYDASGNKLKKTVQEINAIVPLGTNNYTSNITTVTSYIGGFTFQSKTFSNASLSSLNQPETLLYGVHEDGRMRMVLLPTGLYGWVFDYFIRDHLGNLRVTLTDEAQTDTYPAATLESGGMAYEQTFYNIISGNVIVASTLPWWINVTNNNYNNSSNGVPLPPDPTVNPNDPSTKLYKLNGQTGNRFGMGIAIKVMAGDIVSVYGKSIWHDGGQTTNNTSYPISGVLASFIDAFSGTDAVIRGSKGTVNGSILNGNSNTTGPLSSLLNGVATPPGQTPKAYINWILFDEQFKPVAGGNGADPIDALQHKLKSHGISSINIIKSGYLYVYCSNESNQDVYFDNLQVVHTRGPLVDERHFYPYGLSMFGISSRAFGKLQVNFGYQSKELQNGEFYDGSGLELYDFEARYFDPQLGRWWAQDPVLNFSTPYGAMRNNPMSYLDGDGRNPLILAAVIVGAAFGAYTGYRIAEAKGYNLGDLKTWGYMLGGAAIGGFSGYAGATISASGAFMAQTMGIMYGSAFNSFGMTVLSGGMLPPSISFGVASFNFESGEWGYAFRKGNSFLQNLGYTFGAMANLQDLVTAFWGGNYEFQYETDKANGKVGHGAIRERNATNDVKISVANLNTIHTKHGGILGAIEWAWKSNFRKWSGGPEYWKAVPPEGWPRIPLRLNSKIIDWMAGNLEKGRGLWGISRTRFGVNFGCVNYAARALWTAGVPTIPIINFLGPRVLWLQLAIRQVGIDASYFLLEGD